MELKKALADCQDLPSVPLDAYNSLLYLIAATTQASHGHTIPHQM